MSLKGVIFDIQRFSVNDGPGIRTTVFMKGCGLGCKWCHNPESISPVVELKYDSKKCVLCKACVNHVNGDGIEVKGDELVIDFNKHKFNFDLINVCSSNAYSTYGEEYSVDEVVELCLKDKDYYQNSDHGGVTFSGGEAINQIRFITEVAKELKKHDIHICLDISGKDPQNVIKDTLSFVDVYLLDYKVTDESLYEKYIGKGVKFKETIDLLEKNNKKVILRCPIIKTVNDTDDHLKAIAKLSNDYKSIWYTDILPYHNLVKSFQFRYVTEHRIFEVPSKQEKEDWKKALLGYNIRNAYMESEQFAK